MKNTLPLLVLALAGLPFLAGCPVFQSQRTPVNEIRLSDADSGNRYWVYLPSHYSTDRSWLLVITLHSGHGVDSSSDQVREWKALAEQYGFLVAAPDIDSPQALTKASRDGKLAHDEQVILSCSKFMQSHYKVEPKAVMLTAFGAGGYALYYTALRHGQEFPTVAARACNSDIDIFENAPLAPQGRHQSFILLQGHDNWGTIGTDTWAAFRWLREHGFKQCEHNKVDGVYLRQPQIVLEYWQKYLPQEYHMDVKDDTEKGSKNSYSHRRNKASRERISN